MSDVPAPRKPILLRAGPSKTRPLVVDGIAGGVGLMLLVASIALVGLLPEEEVMDPQYKVTFSTTPYDKLANGFSSPVFDFVQEGDVAEAQFEVVDPNVATISFGFFILEDKPATLPDTFRLEVTAPNGTLYTLEADGGVMTTLPVTPNTQPADQRGTQFWVSEYGGTGVITARFGLQPVPDDYIFTTEPGFELFEVREAVRAEHFNEDALGVWTVRMTLENAGDCPELDPTSPLFQRAQECRVQNAGGGSFAPGDDPAVDLGNPITFSSFEYTWFNLAVEAQ